MSIIETFKKLVDPVGAREQAEELRKQREQPSRDDAGPPPSFECRVCGYLGPERDFCPDCLAQTMRPTEKRPATGAQTPLAEEAPAPPPVEIPIEGTLDLHTVQPAEAASMLAEYLEACAARGLRELRVVHGKGTGAMRRTVEAVLRRSPLVESFRAGDEAAGGWGATLVTLRPR